MAVQNVRIKYSVDKADVTSAKKAVADLAGENENLEDSFKKINRSSASATSGIKKGFGEIGSMAKGVGVAIAASFALDSLTSAGKKIIEVTSKFQKFEAVLTNTLGSKSAARRALADIQQFAATTPFQVDEITESYIKLANRGVKPTTAQLRQLGDLAASQGKSLDQLTEAALDAMSGENERLKEFGIQAKKVGDNTIFTFKGVPTTVRNSEKAIQEYILSLGDAVGVTGSMAAISGTLEGQMSNLDDAVDGLALAFGEVLAPAISASVSALAELTKGATAALKGTAAVLQSEELSFFEKVRAFVGSAFGDVNSIATIAATAAIKQVKDLGTEVESTTDKTTAGHAKSADQIAKEKKALEELIKAREAYKKLVEDLGRGEDVTGLRSMFDEYFEQQEKIKEAAKKAGIDSVQLMADLAKSDFDLRQKLMLSELNTQVEVAGKRKEIEEAQNKEKLDRQKNLDKALEDRAKLTNENLNKIAQEAFEEERKRQERLNELKQQGKEFAIDSLNAVFEFSSQARSRDLEQAQANAENDLKRVGDNAQARAFIQKRLADEEARIKTRQAQADKQQALLNIALQAAPGIIKYTAGLPFTAAQLALLVATTAIQTALVASRPIPKFARGTDRLNGKPGTDTNLAWLNTGERVVPTEVNNQLKGIKNKDLPTYVRLGKMVMNNNNTSNNLPVVNELKGLRTDMKGRPTVVNELEEKALRKFVYSSNRKKEILNNKFSW